MTALPLDGLEAFGRRRFEVGGLRQRISWPRPLSSNDHCPIALSFEPSALLCLRPSMCVCLPCRMQKLLLWGG